MPWPVEQKYIDEAEQALGVRFPPLFVASLREVNGGECTVDDQTWWFHPVWDQSDRRRSSRTSNDVVRETRYARRWPGFPPSAVAIARGAGSELLVLIPSAEDPTQLDEKIYAWDVRRDLELVAASMRELKQQRL